jgi:oligosaccharide repeat unit polymerase
MKHTGIISILCWWLFWQLIHNLNIVDIKVASSISQINFLLFYLGLIIGYFSIVYVTPPYIEPNGNNISRRLQTYTFFNIMSFLFFLIALVVIVSSGAFTMPFNEYFLLRRGLDAESIVTGSQSLDFFVKMFSFAFLLPSLIFSIVTVIMKIRTFSIYDFLNVFSVITITYAFQINYTLIFFMFAVFVIYMIFNKNISKNGKRLVVISAFSLILLLMLSSINRYGSFDIFEIIMYYPVSYFSMSFSLYDYNISNETSIIHQHTYGLSMMGNLLIFLKYFFKFLGFGSDYFVYPSIDNVYSSSVCTYVSEYSGKCYNAFTSILFTLYRDFGTAGAPIGGGVFGSLLAYLNFKRHKSTCYQIIYIYTLVGLLLGIMVSPFELSYYLFGYFFIFLFSLRFKFGISK